MKTKHFTKWSFVIISAFTLSFYVENIFAAYDDHAGQSEISSSTASRLVHARELLGSSYSGSLAEKSAIMPSVTHFVYTTFQDKLEGKWKKHAANLSATIIAESERHGFDPLFVMAVIQTESHFDPTILGSHGEIGLMQIKMDTAKWISQKEGIAWKGKSTLKNPVMNVRIGIAYLAFLRKNFSGAARHYVAAYNMGPANVRKLASQSIQPHEYSSRVMTNYNQIYTQLVKL
jgi:peptidoglycan lytic transglycosylase